MVKRNIILIDENKCNGCGNCVPNCHEGALQMIDGKARLISDLFCDGLGACIGQCPAGAITIVERDAEPYDEKKVIEENIIPKGKNTLAAHLNHLVEHGANEYYDEAVEFLKEKGIEIPTMDDSDDEKVQLPCGCPGTRLMDFDDLDSDSVDQNIKLDSKLRQWPVQLHLLPPDAPFIRGKDLLLAADCTAYAFGDFHKGFLNGKAVAIACPKLDSGIEKYLDKLEQMVKNINILYVAIMEVPCCHGLLELAKKAVERSGKKIPIKKTIIGVKGNIINEEWV